MITHIVEKITLGSLLLLVHHQLNHVVLIHEFLTLADSIFALYYISVLRVNVFAFGVRSISACLLAQGPREVLHISVVGLDSRLARESLRGWLVVELGLVLLGQCELCALIPIERLILLVAYGWVLQYERIALEFVGFVLGLRGHTCGAVLWLLNILVY